MASAPRAVEAGETLDSLVDQFSDPFAFLRELIQNAIDAGSTQVWVSFEFRPSKDGDKGIFILHIDDTGEGMNREIIDTQLTRLFSSSKENDLTKIGKFGIGFVSVFALKPNAVIVDTGRGGENWRIFFKEDKSFDRIVLDRPVDGTQIQFIKEIESTKFGPWVEKSLATIKLWCKHAEAEIYVDGQQINEPFEFSHPLAVTHEVQGTSVYLEPTLEEKPFLGFYNRGLTLYENHDSIIPGVAFKIRSRYVEHTLTRDNVIKDENYHKAMAVLHEAVQKTLRPRLFAAAAAGEDLPGHGGSLDAVLGYLSHRLDKLPDSLASLPILSALHGPKASLKDLQKQLRKCKELFYDSQANQVTEALAQDDHLILRWSGPEGDEPGLGLLLRTVAGKLSLTAVNKAYVLPLLDNHLPPKDLEQLRAAMQILNHAGSPYKKLIPADLSYPGSAVGDCLYLAQSVPGQLERVDKQVKQGFLGFLFAKLGAGNSKSLLVNMAHPLIKPHFSLRSKYPALATYLLAKALTLDDGISAATEAKMLEAVFQDEASLEASLRD